MGKIPRNPCEGVELPKLKRPKAEVNDTDECKQVLEAAKGTDMYLIVLLDLSAGLRRGELLALKWEHVDFESKQLHIRENTVRANGSTITKTPKSEAGTRNVTVGAEVIAALTQAKADYEKDKALLGRGFHDDGYVIRQKDGKPYQPDSLTQKWGRFLKQHDLRHIKLHGLRHTHATALIQAGVSPKVVQERLGHADVTITLNTYTHVLPKMDQEAADKLDKILFPDKASP